MVKSELIKHIAGKIPSLNDKDVELAINQILDCITASLCDGKRLEIRGFGSFSLHHRPPRKARNPRTGEPVITESKYLPHFKPGKELRERINKD